METGPATHLIEEIYKDEKLKGINNKSILRTIDSSNAYHKITQLPYSSGDSY